VPFTACLVVLGRHVEGLRFLEVMLGDEPALTQEETFYQRALAGDSAEITYQGEIVLKDEPLEDYLDDVALKGLQLAERDRERGVLDADNLNKIRGAVEELMENLADFEPRRWFRKIVAEKSNDETADQTGLASLAGKEDEQDDPLPVLEPGELRAGWTEPKAILCLGTRTSLDDAAALMLAGLLKKHGLRAQTIDHEAIAEGSIISLEESVKLVCLSSLNIGLSTSHIRYLVRRLRRIIPHSKIVIGYWNETSAPVKTLGEIVEADGYATSLHETAEMIIDFARVAQPDSQPETTSEKPEEVVSGSAALNVA